MEEGKKKILNRGGSSFLKIFHLGLNRLKVIFAETFGLGAGVTFF